jgi:hypothetical protein
MLKKQYDQQIELKINGFQTKGANNEKMKRYQKAISDYKRGKILVEQYMGSEHPAFSMFCSALGGAKLKSKY